MKKKNLTISLHFLIMFTHTSTSDNTTPYNHCCHSGIKLLFQKLSQSVWLASIVVWQALSIMPLSISIKLSPAIMTATLFIGIRRCRTSPHSAAAGTSWSLSIPVLSITKKRGYLHVTGTLCMLMMLPPASQPPWSGGREESRWEDGMGRKGERR